MRSLIRAFASRLNILWLLSFLEFLSLKGGCNGSCQNATLLEITCHGLNSLEFYNVWDYVTVWQKTLSVRYKVITYKKIMKFSTNINKLLHYVHLLYSEVLS